MIPITRTRTDAPCRPITRRIASEKSSFHLRQGFRLRSTNGGSSTLNFFARIFYETDRPTKSALEKKWIEQTRDEGSRDPDQQSPQ
jgi:hypothetical protein